MIAVTNSIKVISFYIRNKNDDRYMPRIQGNVYEFVEMV